ncbi:MAG TPA: tetratricopeptide repeat protein [Rhodanobacter sp.]
MKHAQAITMLASATLLLALASTPAQVHASQATKQGALYPDATRIAPKLDAPSGKEQKNLVEGLNAVNTGDKAKAEQLLQPIVDGSKSKYAQAKALEGLGNLKSRNGDAKGAIAAVQRALEIGTLSNDDYFQIQYELAVYQQMDQQYQASLITLTKWRADGKKETADSYALEGNDDYRLHKYPEAIAAIKKAQLLTDKPEDQWSQILLSSYAESGQADKAAEIANQQFSANPNDPNAVNNAVAVLMQAKRYPEAIQVMEKARASGLLKKETDYVNLASIYINAAQADAAGPQTDATKAAQVMEDGMAKGIISLSPDNYFLLGEAQELAGNDAKALDAYAKALPTAKNGEAGERAAQLLLADGKYSEAKNMAEQAISKGVKHMGVAYMMLAESELGLKNKPASIAAAKLAEKDPETAKRATAWQKKLAAGK